MGQYIGMLRAGWERPVLLGNITTEKRKHLEDSEPELPAQEMEDYLLHTPRRKKMKTTSDYIYQVLFVNGENSDITITALGKEWPLHRLYLRQCGYFESMFSGSWRESNASRVSLDIPDDNIDVDALTVAFGCLYRDDIAIEPIRVIPILAAASLLQLDGLMQQCASVMKETISVKTVCKYYESAKLYGVKSIEKECIEWLENNIMCKQCSHLLKRIGIPLMAELVKSANLFVMQVEMDIYNLLKRWLFLQIMPSWSGSYKSGLTRHAETHFRLMVKEEFGENGNQVFLETTLGRKYCPVFANLRFEHIIIDLMSTQLVLKDCVVPKEWLTPYFKNQWMLMLTMETCQDSGPTAEAISEEVFLQSSLRCARILNKEAEYQWRWIGFNYGIDLVVMYANRLLIFKRNCGNQSRLLSNQQYRHIMFRLTISSLNDMGHVTYCKSTDLKTHGFVKDEELVVLSVDKKATFPLRICLNALFYTPSTEPNMRVHTTSNERAKVNAGTDTAAPTDLTLCMFSRTEINSDSSLSLVSRRSGRSEIYSEEPRSSGRAGQAEPFTGDITGTSRCTEQRPMNARPSERATELDSADARLPGSGSATEPQSGITRSLGRAGGSGLADFGRSRPSGRPAVHRLDFTAPYVDNGPIV